MNRDAHPDLRLYLVEIDPSQVRGYLGDPTAMVVVAFGPLHARRVAQGHLAASDERSAAAHQDWTRFDTEAAHIGYAGAHAEPRVLHVSHDH